MAQMMPGWNPYPHMMPSQGMVPPPMGQQAPGPQAPQAQHAPKSHGGASAGQRNLHRRGSQSDDEGLKPIPTFPDDDTKLSTAYKTVGALHMSGKTRCLPRKFRASVINCCNPDLWSMVLLSQLDEEDLDFLFYCVTLISPLTPPREIGADTKGACRRSIAVQYRAKHKRNPSRLACLSEELDNVAACAMKMGYNPTWLSPVRLGQWQANQRVRAHLSDMGAFERAASPSASPEPIAKSKAPQPLTENGEHTGIAPALPPLPEARTRRSEEASAEGATGKQEEQRMPPALTNGEFASVPPGSADAAVSWSMGGLKLPSLSKPAASVRISSNERGAKRGLEGPSGRRGTSPGRSPARADAEDAEEDPELGADYVSGDEDKKRPMRSGDRKRPKCSNAD